MSLKSGCASASPNIAFIKYWGNRDPVLRLPSNGSISMTLDNLETTTTVQIDPNSTSDSLFINGKRAEASSLKRVSTFLDQLRHKFGRDEFIHIQSTNNFPAGTGIASSASAFAALTAAYIRAIEKTPSNRELSMLARLGSGSACRSIYGGFVEWYASDINNQSYAEQIAPPTYWDLVDIIAVIGYAHKSVGSFAGHSLANTSSLQQARILSCKNRLDACRKAILSRDFELLADTAELDSNMMHAVMLTSSPSLIYWEPATIEIMKSVQALRKKGIPVFYTIDAGPNVHCVTTSSHKDRIIDCLDSLPSVHEIFVSSPGHGIRFPES